MSIIYCPVCGKNIDAENKKDVDSGEHDGYIYVHDDVNHDDSSIEALENGIN